MNPNPIQTETKNHSQPNNPHSDDYAPYPKLDLDDVTTTPPPPPAADNWTSVPVGSQPQSSPPPLPIETPRSSEVHQTSAPISGSSATTMPAESNPYVSPAAVQKNKMDTVRDVLGKWGQKAAEATKKAEDYAGNVWQHLKTGPSMADAAVGRIAQGTKVLAEGGYEKIFRATFETVPEEQLLKSYACYLSTSAGPVMGVLYVSSAKIAFSSDSPLSYKVGEETQWSYYKVVLPLNQLKAVNPSKSKVNSAEKYIQVISVDNHEFWFMGFVNYDSAVKTLQNALPSHPL